MVYVTLEGGGEVRRVAREARVDSDSYVMGIQSLKLLVYSQATPHPSPRPPIPPQPR